GYCGEADKTCAEHQHRMQVHRPWREQQRREQHHVLDPMMRAHQRDDGAPSNDGVDADGILVCVNVVTTAVSTIPRPEPAPRGDRSYHQANLRMPQIKNIVFQCAFRISTPTYATLGSADLTLCFAIKFGDIS